MTRQFEDSRTLGKFKHVDPIQSEEMKAQYERIAELKASLAEMVSIYWGEGDGFEPPPQCIQRAQAALSDEAR